MKTCVMCKHFNISEGSPGYSEVTPGYSMRISCEKAHWQFDELGDGVKEFRQCMLLAGVCKDYEKAPVDPVTLP